MTDSVFDEMKEVLALQKKAHIDEGPASYELRLDRLNRLSQMLKKYSDEIVDTISEDYGTRDKNSTFLSEVSFSIAAINLCETLSSPKFSNIITADQYDPIGFAIP